MSGRDAHPARGLTAVVVGIALALGGAAVGATPAWADDGQAQADQAATAIAAAVPGGGDVVAPAGSGDTAVAIVDGTQVSVPGSSDGAVTVAPTDPAITALVMPVTVSLPKESGGKHAKAARDGTVVYPGGSASGAGAAVQVLSDGSVRLSTVLRSDKSPTRFTYEIGGATPVLQPDGSVDLVQTITGDGVQAGLTVGHIDPAWATDAKGAPVATHYEVPGNSGKLVQVISPDKNAAYPIVADPRVVLHWTYQIVLFSKSETNTISWGAAGAATLLWKVPALGAVLASGAGLLAAYSGYLVSVGKCLAVYHLGLASLAIIPYSYPC